MELDETLCYCFHVKKRKIVNHLRVHRPIVPSQLSECAGAGTGCGWCVPYLKKCFRDFQAGVDLNHDDISTQEYSQGRASYIAAGHGTPPSQTR